MTDENNNNQVDPPLLENLEEDAAPRSLMDYVMSSLRGTASSIRRPAIAANNFEIKSTIIQMIQLTCQFSCLAHEDPNAHIGNFLEICDTFKHNGVTDDAIRLRLFPFSLRDKDKNWLYSLPTESITTWDALAQRFLAKYFPPSKTARMRNDITNFMQVDGESLYEAWERYRELLRKSSGGTIMKKTSEAAYELLDEMASNSYQWQSNKVPQRKAAGLCGVDAITTIST